MASSVQVIPLETATQLPTRDSSSLCITTERLSLQAGHRLAAIAIFATFGAWALLYQSQSDRWAVVIALGASDLGLCMAMVAGLLARRDGRRPTLETHGVFIVNLVLIALSIQLMLFSRLDIFRTAIAKFFSPS
jgi:hypothetical protein